MRPEKEPLYRKENKLVRNYRGDKGGDFRHERHSKKMKEFEGSHRSMGGNKQRGLDYTPLYRFLVSRVGRDWDEVYSEAHSRLDKDEPIFLIVALEPADRRDAVRTGESSLWSGLYVDDNNILQKVNPDLTVDDFLQDCNCCTLTFNGQVAPRPEYLNAKPSDNTPQDPIKEPTES
jgi:hypothetical protein